MAEAELAGDRDRDVDGTKAAILAAAEAVFAECGFDLTSLKAIGDAAGVSRSTPTYFFGNKSQLYDAVLARVIERASGVMLDAYTTTGRATDLDDAVTGYVAVLLGFLASDYSFVRLIQREALADASRVADLFGKPVEDALTALAPAAERAGVSPQQLVLDVIALCWYPFAHEHTLLPALGMNPRDPDFLENHTRHIVRIVMALTGGDEITL
jgi:TetR/AcrR family transcriptional regulator